MRDLVVTIGGFVLLLALLVGLRIATQSKLEVRTPDIVLALIPVALWLLLAGKIKTVEYGGLVQGSSAVAVRNNPAFPTAGLQSHPAGVASRSFPKRYYFISLPIALPIVQTGVTVAVERRTGRSRSGAS